MAEKSLPLRAEESFEKNLKPRFRWDKEEGINNLIQCLLRYWPEMEFEGKNLMQIKVRKPKKFKPNTPAYRQ